MKFVLPLTIWLLVASVNAADLSLEAQKNWSQWRGPEAIDASPTVVGNQLFLRGRKYLYCLAEK